MSAEPDTGLNRHALGLGETIVMGIAGTAPAFSVAATMATLAAAVGVLAPASLLYCGLAMFGTVFAFRHLSGRNPSAGASFTWVGEAFNPGLGFLAGWAVLISSAVFMVSGTIPAATATLDLVSPGHAQDTLAVTLVAAAWMVAIGGIVLKGIKTSSYFQVAMTTVEVVVLLAVIVGAIIVYAGQPAHSLDWRTLLGAGFTPTLFATGALTALFFYWGWDVTANLNEETREAERTAGKAALLSLVFIVVAFVAFTVAALLALSDKEIQDSGTNVVLAVAQKIVPTPWSYPAVIAVMFSTIGTLETNILQFTRMLFAMARDGAFHRRYATLHSKYRTPWAATLAVTLIGLVLLFLSSWLPGVSTIVKDSVNAVGLQVAFYYGLTCLASAWLERRRRGWAMVTAILWPVISALFLFGVAAYSVPTFDGVTLAVSLGGLALGVVPLAWGRVRSGSGH